MQQGSVLLVSLIFLFLLTAGGIASINLSTTESKITGYFIDKKIAFNAAEAALVQVEDDIKNTEFDLTSFTAACANGYCFNGTNATEPTSCELNTVSPWEDSLLWSNASRVQRVIVIINNDVSLSVPVIVEFLCYVLKENTGPEVNLADALVWAKFFRITVLATGLSQDTRVMLQTTYKKNN